MEREIKSTLNSRFSNLLHSQKAEDFKISKEVEDNLHLLVKGSRSDAEHWGDNRYSIDLLFNLRKSDDSRWDEIEDTVEEYQDESSEILSQSVGYSGSVVLRANSNENILHWERRMLIEYEDSEE